MTRRLLITYLTISALALAALAIPLGITFAQRERDRLYFEIERDASAVAALSEDALENGTPPPLEATLARYRETTRGRIVVVDKSGKSVADSNDPNAPAENYSNRPEITSALQGRRASGTRHSNTTGGSLVYVAIPVASGGVVHGAVRITYPTAALDARVRNAWVRLGLLCAFVLAAIAAVGFLLARSVTRPVQKLEETAEQMADGDLSARAPTDHGAPELRALAATFNRTAGRLEQLVDAQERFVADAAHQLRSPLAALRLRLENFEPHLPPSEAPKVDATIEEVARLSRIVDGLLMLARSDVDHAGLHPVDVAEVARERVDAWRNVGAEQGVTLRPVASGHLWARTPVGAVEQILDNLLANAIAVAPTGSHVTVSASSAGRNVELRVNDEGPGLAPDQREQAFERFWRGGSSTHGTGLGLPIVRQLARLAGGDARLEVGDGGRGLAAVVVLPRVPKSAAEAATTKEPLTLR
jgi:signal transduction histidine kinase